MMRGTGFLILFMVTNKKSPRPNGDLTKNQTKRKSIQRETTYQIDLIAFIRILV